MPKKYRAVKLTAKGDVTNEEGDAVVCPVNIGSCNCNCAWFSMDGRVLLCKDTPVGAIRSKPVQSFRLSTGPQVYEPLEPDDFDIDE